MIAAHAALHEVVTFPASTMTAPSPFPPSARGSGPSGEGAAPSLGWCVGVYPPIVPMIWSRSQAKVPAKIPTAVINSIPNLERMFYRLLPALCFCAAKPFTDLARLLRGSCHGD
jgi:hypothetical protein